MKIYSDLKKGFYRFIINLLLALAFSGAVYYSVDFFVLKNWNSKESLVVMVLAMGEETPVHVEKEPMASDDMNGVESLSDHYFQTLERTITVKSLTGKQEGRTYQINVTRLAGTGADLALNKRYILVQDTFEDGSKQYSIADSFRVSSVAAFVAFSSSTLIVFAGWAGFKALLGLVLSLICLLWGIVPLIADGWKPIPLAFAAVLIISVLTVACVVKRPRYRSVALLGSLGGAAGGFLLGLAMVYAWQLNGLAGESATLLMSTMPNIDIRGILLASVIIGSIGAVLDVGVSITASMAELVDYDPEIPLRRLWAAGINVGTEVLGSMINTLILAYMGSSLAMMVLISNAGADVIGLLNDPYIAQELVQSLAGTAGLLLTIPATASFFILQEKYTSRTELQKEGYYDDLPKKQTEQE